MKAAVFLDCSTVAFIQSVGYNDENVHHLVDLSTYVRLASGQGLRHKK